MRANIPKFHQTQLNTQVRFMRLVTGSVVFSLSELPDETSKDRNWQQFPTCSGHCGLAHTACTQFCGRKLESLGDGVLAWTQRSTAVSFQFYFLVEISQSQAKFWRWGAVGRGGNLTM